MTSDPNHDAALALAVARYIAHARSCEGRLADLPERPARALAWVSIAGTLMGCAVTAAPGAAVEAGCAAILPALRRLAPPEAVAALQGGGGGEGGRSATARTAPTKGAEPAKLLPAPPARAVRTGGSSGVVHEEDPALAVFVDDMHLTAMGRLGRMRMSHMIADTDAELHAMAERIGVARRHFQGDHYDVCLAKRRLAVEAGAVEVTMRNLVRRLGRGRTRARANARAAEGRRP